MHENMKIKPKGGIEWSYRPWGRKTLQKLRKKTTKNLKCCLAKSEREEKLKNFWRRCFWNSQRTVFKKPEIRSSIDRKTGSINRTRQRLTKFLKQDFDWSKNRLDQSKFWKNSFLREKTKFFENTIHYIEFKRDYHLKSYII